MPTFSGIEQKKTQLIRKARNGSVFIAPITATAVTALTTTSSGTLQALPTGYKDLGLLTSDGVNYGRNTDVSDVRSFGRVEPTRSDVTSDTMTMAVTAQETKLETIGLYTGVDTTSISGDSTTKEVQIAKPSRPGFKFYRLIGIFVDDSDAGEIYMARFMPRSRVTAFGEQVFSDGDAPVEYNVTFTGYEDSTLGYSHKWLFGGPGWIALMSDMGIS